MNVGLNRIVNVGTVDRKGKHRAGFPGGDDVRTTPGDEQRQVLGQHIDSRRNMATREVEGYWARVLGA